MLLNRLLSTPVGVDDDIVAMAVLGSCQRAKERKSMGLELEGSATLARHILSFYTQTLPLPDRRGGKE